MDETNKLISPDDIRTDEIRIQVRERYAGIAEQKSAGCCGSAESAAASCCGPAESASSSCCGSFDEPQALDQVARLYEAEDVGELPAEVTALSLGCGDPVTLASLQPGQTVLDLGSGGGIDCFLAAKRVGPSGRVIGVDMTPQMIDRARSNKEKLQATNVEFRLGEIEHLPVADASVDVVISNCVINLSPDKPQVFREAFRVLRPGGRLAVSDIVTNGPLPEAVKRDLSAWAGCVSGALDQAEYLAALAAAGFEDIQLTPAYWDQEIVEAALDQLELQSQVDAGRAAKAVFSAKVSARKPKG